MGSNSSRSRYPKPLSGKIKFDRNNVLGEGNSVVFRGTYKGKDVAVKRIELKPSKTADREYTTQIKLDHQNVLKILTVEQDKDFRFIVLEICGGTLRDVCNEKYKGPELPSDETVLREIASGLNYIHVNKLVHRDIKPENILISSTTPVHIKLSDFGLSKETSSSQTYTVSGYRGTSKWMAPELLDMRPNSYSANETENKKRGSCKSDIFSAGCVFFYFVTRGVHPYEDSGNGSEEFIIRNIRVNNQVNIYKLRRNHFASEIIRGMMQSQPDNRLTLEEVLKHLDKPHSKPLPVTFNNVEQNDMFSPRPWARAEGFNAVNPSSSYRVHINGINSSITTVKSVGVKRAATLTMADRQIRTRIVSRSTTRDSDDIKIFSVEHNDDF